MPVKSKVQERFFNMCLHSPQHAKGKCPPASVAREILSKPRPKRMPERKKSYS